MSEMSATGQWVVTDEDLEAMTARRAHDLMVECFFVAQHEIFERTRVRLRLARDDKAIRDTVESIVRRAFADAGYDYDAPILPALHAVAESLKHESVAYGTPQDVVEHHAREYEKVLAALDRSAGLTGEVWSPTRVAP